MQQAKVNDYGSAGFGRLRFDCAKLSSWMGQFRRRDCWSGRDGEQFDRSVVNVAENVVESLFDGPIGPSLRRR